MRAAGAGALALAASLSAAGVARAEDVERRGGRFGVSLDGGYGAIGDDGGGAAGAALAGVTLRFGGAFTDRFHLLGEFRLAALLGPTLRGYGSATANHAALDVALQGYIGPRFFLRGGAGVGWSSALAGDTWLLPLPGPRVSGALGYDVWRDGERSLSVSLGASYTALYRREPMDSLVTVSASVGFDWY